MPGESSDEGKAAGSRGRSHSLHDEAWEWKRRNWSAIVQGRNNINADRHCRIS